MEIKEIIDKDIWENFLLGCEEKTFLSSWNWGEFQRNTGNKIWRLGIYKGAKLLSVVLVIKIIARRGTFLFVPHGPASAKATAGEPNIKYEVFKILLDELRKITREENTSFIRIAPIWGRNEESIKAFKKLNFRGAPIHIHPEVTWELDITLPEEEILMNMRKTTRYLVRQGLKNPDLKIEQSQELEDIEKFNKLYQETVDRHHFVPFSFEYLKNEFQAFLADNQISLFFAKYEDEILAGAMIIFWQGIAFYHQGASSQKHSKIPASYLLQWETIREAKRRGCKTYNFWGIAPIVSGFGFRVSDLKSHPWKGLTLFKMGFGGYKKEYVKTQDFPISKKYWLTYIFEKLRRTKRGL